MAVADPAIAPLGTDEEAAGTPVSSDVVAQALRQELRPPGHGKGQAGLGAAWILVGFIAAAVMASFAYLIWLAGYSRSYFHVG